MTQPLVECIPNYSEARRPEVIDRIVESIQSVTGIHILDRSSDTDHNRTVITFIGAPSAVEEAAYRSIAKAAEWIDLDHHTGEHPRIGATDVVPFVPIQGVTMAECISMARRLGQRVGDELGIPVYLYEEAATSPARQNLENIRRGQYELLKQEIGTQPDRKPDFGPARVTGAGATVIGARQPLIAYNVYLTTGDVSIARAIAASLRHSSGGWRYLKAMGVLVDGQAQVSMNFTNFEKTPLFRVVESIRREAARYGVAIHRSELVGLIPQKALTDAAVWYLQLDGFTGEQVLEKRVQASLPEPAEDFCDRLAAATPAPGGGSSAAYAGAMGAALIEMVCGLTLGKKKYAGAWPRLKEIQSLAQSLRQKLQETVELDASAFDALMAAGRLPGETDLEREKRGEELETATVRAAEIPLDVCRMSVQVMALALEMTEIGNVNAVSDVACGLTMARAAVTAAGWNVRINLKSLSAVDQVKAMHFELADLEDQAARLDAEMAKWMKTLV